MGNTNSRSVTVDAIVGFDVIAVVSSFSPSWNFTAGWDEIANQTGFSGNGRISVFKRTADSDRMTFAISSHSWGAGTILLMSLTNTVDLTVLESFNITEPSDFVEVPDKEPGQSVLWALCTAGNTGQAAHQLWEISPGDILQFISTHAAQGGGSGTRQTVAIDRGSGVAFGRVFQPPGVTDTNFGVIMLEIISTGQGLTPPWGIEPTILNGYPHPPAVDKDLLGLELLFRFFLSDLELVGWKMDDDTLDGYPFSFFRVLEPPPPPPPPLAEITDINLKVPGRYVGSETDVKVSLGLQDVLAGDGVTIRLYRNGTVYYETTADLSDGAETFAHTIPSDTFVGLNAGSFVVRAKLCRDDEIIYEVGADYCVVLAPTVIFCIIEPQEIQLPITTPLNISSRWIMMGEGINRIQGSATLGGLPSTSFDLNSQTFYVNFQNVTDIAVGSHSIGINLTITSDRYGTATASALTENVLTVHEPIPEPEIISVNLDGVGRYIGIPIPVTVSVGLENIRDGDSISVRLRQGGAVFYEHYGDLSAEATTYSNTIPQTVFHGLAVGAYTVQVVVLRDYAIADEKLANYRIVDTPTVQILYVSPNTIQLPMAHPENIDVTMQVFGAGVDSIAGTVTLDDTGFSSCVNTSNSQFTVSLLGVGELSPRGYSISANLTVTSSNYGTVTLSEEFYNVFRALPEVVPIQRNLRSNTLYIYDGFTLVHILNNYISLKWVRRYNRSGEFTLHLPNTPENVALAKEGYIIAKDNDDEAAFIEDVKIDDNIEIKGAFISKMLSFRVVNLTSENLVNLQATADSLIRANFINTSPERVIPGFRIANYTISTQNVLARIENGTVEQWLEQQDIGFKVAFLPQEQAFEFSLYDGCRSAAEFCENFRNITDQQFFHQTAQARNVVIVEGQPIESSLEGGEPIRNIITIGNAQGLARREAYTRSGRFPMVDFGNQFLRNNVPVRSLDVKIVDPYIPFKYRTDYDVGDIVTIISESKNVTVTENIMEVTEFYDKTGFHIYAIFGRVPRDLLMELQDNNNRLDDMWNHPETPPLDLELILDLLIPPLLDEIFDLIEFPPLPDWLYPWENFRGWLETTTNEVLDIRLRPEIIEILEELLPTFGHGGHLILDRLPTQAQIDLMPENAVVVVYNPNDVFTPLS